jgi:pilus assembly protein CpaB
MKAARVVVLSVALAAGGIAALLAGRSEKPAQVKQLAAPKIDTVDVLVAKSDLSTGQLVSPQDVKWQPWPATVATGNFIRKTTSPDAIEKLSGMIVRVPFVTGEPIREAKLVNAKGSGFMAAILPEGMRAVSTQISPETGAGGFILPNDHVDVILTRRDTAATKAAGGDVQTSETVLSNVRVLAIDQTIREKEGQRDVIGKTATLELTPRQAETLTLAQHLGSLSLSLRSITDAQRDTPKTDETLENVGSGHSVNVIRFGVSTPSTAQ